jgi:ribosomal protein L7/L12
MRSRNNKAPRHSRRPSKLKEETNNGKRKNQCDNRVGQDHETEFTPTLVDFGANKLAVIKLVREVLPSLGLKEAKELVESCPKPIKENISKEEAEAIKAKFEEAGAKIELK